MAAENLYQFLQIPEYSDINTIKKAFRQLALRYHPDRNPDPEAAETFKSLLKTYEILSSPQLKQAYDERLRFGSSFTNTAQPTFEAVRDSKMRWYAKMRQEKNAIEEVENLAAYERSKENLPLIWRFLLSGLLLITGIIFIMSDWYQAGSKMTLGGFILIFALIIIWNELYKYYWHQSLTDGSEKEMAYDNKSFQQIFKLFLFSVLLIFVSVKLKKIWHLHYFGEVIYASLNAESNRIFYDYHNKFHSRDAFFIPKENLYKNKILIKVSSKEPEIWDYVLTEP
jgi:curved DNA-binding protein CbpA